MYRYIFLLLFLLTTYSLYSQFNVLWNQRYNGPLNSVDGSNLILVDTLNNIYVIGASAGIGYDFCPVKYDINGNQILLLRYNSPANGTDSPTGAFIDKKLNIYITGRSDSNFSSDYMTVKYNKNGILLWAVRYTSSGSNEDIPLGVIADDSGNVYVGGNTVNKTNLIKYDSNGVMIWNKIHTSSIDGHSASAFTSDSNLNFYFTGYINNQSTVTDFYTLKFNRNGELIWLKTFNGSASLFDEAYNLCIDSKNNVIVNGGNYENNGNFITTIKYDSSGNQIWLKRRNNNGNEIYGTKMNIDHINNIYLTGYTFVTGNNYNFYTTKLDSSGNTLWTHIFNSTFSGSDIPYYITSDTSGRTFVTGSSIGGSGNLDYCTLVYSNAGSLLQELRYNGPGNGDDVSQNVLYFKATNSLLITGSSTGNGSNRDFCTIYYTPITNVPPISNILPRTYSLQQNYPNPFNPVTKIGFSIPLQEYTKIIVYDINGKEINTLVNEMKSPGIYETEFDGSDLASGVYFYKFETGDYSESRTMILVK